MPAQEIRGTLDREEFSEAWVSGLMAAMGIQPRRDFTLQRVTYDEDTQTYDVLIVNEDLADPETARMELAYDPTYIALNRIELIPSARRE